MDIYKLLDKELFLKTDKSEDFFTGFNDYKKSNSKIKGFYKYDDNNRSERLSYNGNFRSLTNTAEKTLTTNEKLPHVIVPSNDKENDSGINFFNLFSKKIVKNVNESENSKLDSSINKENIFKKKGEKDIKIVTFCDTNPSNLKLKISSSMKFKKTTGHQNQFRKTFNSIPSKRFNTEMNYNNTRNNSKLTEMIIKKSEIKTLFSFLKSELFEI